VVALVIDNGSLFSSDAWGSGDEVTVDDDVVTSVEEIGGERSMPPSSLIPMN